MKKIYYFIIALLGRLYYQTPSRKIKMIGVTGTDGKTTTTYLINSIFRKYGKKTMLSNGQIFQIDDKIEKNETNNSTPGRFKLRSLLKEAVDKGLEYAIIEVTSIALDQFRLWGMSFDVCVLTNLKQDHLDYHKTLENYKKAKAKLFKSMSLYKKEGVKKVSILNYDDDSFSYFQKFKADEYLSYSIKTSDADLFADNIKTLEDGTEFLLVYKGKDLGKIFIPLISYANVYNTLAAIAVAFSQGIPFDIVKETLANIEKIEGRFERIEGGQPFQIFVDYAHTPNAFKNIFEHVKINNPDSKIIVVFGSAGGREHEKRSILGELAAEYADFSILTTDDPRFEDPNQIISEIEEGLIKKGKQETKDFIKVIDRYWAIDKALDLAQKGDVVLILGMGSSPMYVKDKKIEWDDRKVVRELLNKKYPTL